MRKKSLSQLSVSKRRRRLTMQSQNLQYFLNQGPFFPLLAVILTMMWHFPITESAASSQLRGEVGGNVTFHCPVDKQRKLVFLYFQRGDVFVNGYHASKEISETWENTRMDHDYTMHMYHLNISYSGDYQCHILYKDGQMLRNHTLFYLSVTANYSEPAHTVNCADENRHISCWVICASHGGYPGTKVTWDIPESVMSSEVNNTQMPDPITMMVNSSSTIYVNCTNGEQTSLSCSVGGVTSKTFNVCTPQDPTETFSPSVITAAVCAVVFVIIIVVLWLKCKKGQRAFMLVSRNSSSRCEANKWT
ncbi:uncharacterized protein LOC121943533 isoform X2 [Plectropomus leopardus]|uniref:uncharacterized protein LOC121943533 isoform X2 n=1 Tax=Plectropomus leopardus TaxID=160734 RepID=UPI001C4B4B6E|nr:uncharacterized protein LOC121943533 isoform X2 [Plectropomus leopardus]XP_042343004.1 uncharacterized protein LOC121943533 isoform X2 [Plectropomus leopardus]